MCVCLCGCHRVDKGREDSPAMQLKLYTTANEISTTCGIEKEREREEEEE